MRDVLVSLKPYYYYLISEGIKTNEIRKSMPKADDWSKNGWFYMSKDEKSFAKIPKKFQDKYRKHFGKVGLKFVCDEITEYESEFWDDETYENIKKVIHTTDWDGYPEIDYNFIAENGEENSLCKSSCLTWEELRNYIGQGINTFHAWHITDLVIYDKPKELYEFLNYNKYQVCKEKPKPPKPTNFDKITESVESLALTISNCITSCEDCPAYENVCEGTSKSCPAKIRKWLQKECD